MGGVELASVLVPVVLTFSIPILIILLKSQVGKSFARYLDSKARTSDTSIEQLVKSEQIYMALDERVQNLELNMKNLQVSNEKLLKMLTDVEKPKQIES
ncbi:hypothetical protein ACFL27_14445 [candidate division CSSED10-310 bacterium]|uniref:Uncharacterized protein n=1 Tax=candidate division CSSED10-310 bacterium TaxID=2855610 RepID=A0ABV6YYW9_UNCC1